MKIKMLFLLFFLAFLNPKLKAQFSFTNMHDHLEKERTGDQFIQQKRNVINDIKRSNISAEIKQNLEDKVNNSETFTDIKKAVNDSNLSEQEKSDILNKFIEEGISENAKNDRRISEFFPAKFNNKGSENSTLFFEGDSSRSHFFQDNNVVYNPNLKNLSFNSEVVNDYMGPFRVGIGFQFNSTVKTEDSLAAAEVKKDQLISSLQNGGGNLFINVKYPFIALGEKENAFGLKSYFYHNTGVELSKINEPDNDFILTNNTGISVGVFGRGIKKEISFFLDATGALLYGNSKFNTILSVDKDFKKVLPLVNIGFGINFSDMYTVKAEFYPVGNYIKKNFPTTISFIIAPKTNHEKK